VAAVEGTSAGLVLAAGGSRRLGRPKQLLAVEGRPLLELVLDQVCASLLDEAVLVLGAHADEVAGAIHVGRARVVLNSNYRAGMSSSLRAGVAAMGESVGRLMVVLGDQPDVSADLLDDLLALQQRSGLPAAALNVDGLLQPPAVFERQLWPELLALAGDLGCRELIRSRPQLVAQLPLPPRLRSWTDVDTLADYERLRERERGACGRR
jgi:molybdenum cofactor cytidylyltransferase